MNDKEKEALIEKAAQAGAQAALKATRKDDRCCGGFTKEETTVVKGWIAKGGFSDTEYRMIKDILSTMTKSKKIFITVFTLFLLWGVKETGEFLWGIIKTYVHFGNGGG